MGHHHLRSALASVWSIISAEKMLAEVFFALGPARLFIVNLPYEQVKAEKRLKIE